jgi:hypothetical protein
LPVLSSNQLSFLKLPFLKDCCAKFYAFQKNQSKLSFLPFCKNPINGGFFAVVGIEGQARSIAVPTTYNAAKSKHSPTFAIIVTLSGADMQQQVVRRIFC